MVSLSRPIRLNRLCVLAAAASLTASLGAQPMLSSMEPRGAQAGSAVRLVLKGTRLVAGARLDLGAAPGLSATPLAIGPSDGTEPAGKLAYLMEVAPSAAAGVYPLRVESNEGISNALLFSIGRFPTAAEEESLPESEAPANDFRHTAQQVHPPVTVEGRLRGAERDIYRVRAAKGRTLVAEVEARRIGSAIDPNLELLDSSGLVRARSADASGLGLDARLSMVAPEDGDYFVVVRDERYSDQAADFYRLTVGDYRYADTVYPLGWGRHSPVEVEFSGGNLPQAVESSVDLSGVSPSATETWVPVPGTPASVPFVVGQGLEVSEGRASGTLRDGVVVNGRIRNVGERDEYILPVRAGEEWAFELRSGELPGSALYGVLEIAHDGGVLAVAGKHAGDPNPYVISTTGQTASFPFVNLAVPPGADELRVSVEDLLGRGGPGFAYRLVARQQGPDFLLRISEPFLNIPSGGSVVVTVTAERRGYFGPIQLYVQDAPTDLRVSGGHIPPTSRLNNTLARFENGQLTLSSLPTAEPRRLSLVIRGRATEAGKDLDRRATGPGIVVPVKGEGQAPVKAEWLGLDLPVRITPPQAGRLEFLTERRMKLVKGGGGLTAQWALLDRRPDAQIANKVDIPRNAGSLRLRKMDGWDGSKGGKFRIFSHERTSLGTMNLNLRASLRIADREQQLISRPLEVEVVEGYGINPLQQGLELAQGGDGTWRGSIWREDVFRRTVSVSATGLPAGIRCETTELEGEQTEFELACSASTDAPIGEHDVDVKAESVLSDEGTTPYPADPANGRITVRR
ncbi:MAG: PPC domain-containing protein [Bryobacterales bacterium]|nr:PPC domain-containing protein [Bryobacterales bacterium]